MSDRTKIIIEYLQNIKRANKEFTKKEHFKDLLHRLYPKNKNVQQIINKMSAGAETTILNIPRKGAIKRGSADTMYNNIIIEFENDLSKTYKHAKEQLAGYLLGKYNSGEGYNYTLIASDFINWRIVAPDFKSIADLGSYSEETLALHEDKEVAFKLTEKNTEDFYHWIDRFLFKEEKQRATLKRVELAFGHNSPTFIECFRQIKQVFNQAKKYGEVQVAYEQWRKFLSIAYGTFEDSLETFVIHTYLSVFAKILAYEILSNDDFIDDEEMKEVLNGKKFAEYQLTEFVENDFFHWVHAPRYLKQLSPVFRLIVQEIANFDFEEVDEDILKGVYQELIDLDTRHALGEYYTPDWLCERIVDELEFSKNKKILDPSCGSGSFLRAAIKGIKTKYPAIKASEINNIVYGIDIHPLSVQIAKTTVLISIGRKALEQEKQPLRINVILANTLLAPEGAVSLFGNEFKLNIDKETYHLNTQILQNVKTFDTGLQICDELAGRTKGGKLIPKTTFNSLIKKRTTGTSKIILDGFYKIYEGFKKVKENNRDSIWRFIVQNLYKPYFLNKKFDYVIGNPPWFTFSSIKNEEYQDILNQLATAYKVKPIRKANYPHLEIAAIFLSYCSKYFLKENGRIYFVLPRSFLSADHHDNTRSGLAEGFKIRSIWDLDKVAPLFRVPSCVIIGDKIDKGIDKRKPLAKGIEGLSFAGKLKYHNCNYEEAALRLTENTIRWYYIKSGNSSAFSNKKRNFNTKENPYKKLFKQGATIVPRAFYFIELNQSTPSDFKDRILNIKTANYIQTNAKRPWKDLSFKDRIESQFIFKTALSNNIAPFALIDTCLVTLPILIKKTRRHKRIELLTADSLLKKGFLDASKWFKTVEQVWDIHKTEKNAKIGASDYVNWQQKLTNQDLNQPYLVLYNSSAKNANATIVERKKIDLEFIVEHKTYVFYTEVKEEAYYLTAVLNSTPPNEIIKDFQSRGLFGARDIHKKILDVYYPKFSSSNDLHIQLAKISKTAHTKTKTYLAKNPVPPNPSPHKLGRIRLAIKAHLSKEMTKIDRLVKKIMKDK